MKILIAEDDKITRALLVRWVSRWGYEPVIAQNGEEALAILLNDMSVQLCVMDWVMPGLSGPEVCKKLRAGRAEPYVYTTLLTSKVETDDVVEGLKAGADDYIQKPCHPLELEVRLRVGRRLLELQTTLIEAREKLRFQATHDGLTHLKNRVAIVDILGAQLEAMRQHGRSVAVVMIDIDHFKQINDTYGHAAGDQVLREVSSLLKKELRALDIAGRYGGEEFLLVLTDCNLEQGLCISEQIRQRIAETPIKFGPISITLSASFGVSSSSQTRYADVELLARAADAALYRSKHAGRNRVSPAEIREFERPSMRPSSRQPDSVA